LFIEISIEQKVREQLLIEAYSLRPVVICWLGLEATGCAWLGLAQAKPGQAGAWLGLASGSGLRF